MRIIFMGTPDFAVPCLCRLIEDGHEVVAVFSQPDRPRGRGHKLCAPPVKECALERGIPVYQPTSLRDGQVLSLFEELAPALCVVVAYGRILPVSLLKTPRLGCVNIHASLLPRLRGAAPIQWSVINGDTQTGVSSMFMAEGLDTGDVILTKETAIAPDETAGALFSRLGALGAACLSETVRLLEEGRAPRLPQDASLATFAPPIKKELGQIDFSRAATELHNLIRGLCPAPMAYTICGGKLLKLRQARLTDGSGRPGEILDIKRLVVACGQGALELLEVSPEGKKIMSGAEFARGKHLVRGEMLTGDSQKNR